MWRSEGNSWDSSPFVGFQRLSSRLLDLAAGTYTGWVTLLASDSFSSVWHGAYEQGWLDLQSFVLFSSFSWKGLTMQPQESGSVCGNAARKGTFSRPSSGLFCLNSSKQLKGRNSVMMEPWIWGTLRYLSNLTTQQNTHTSMALPLLPWLLHRYNQCLTHCCCMASFRSPFHQLFWAQYRNGEESGWWEPKFSFSCVLWLWLPGFLLWSVL